MNSKIYINKNGYDVEFSNGNRHHISFEKIKRAFGNAWNSVLNNFNPVMLIDFIFYNKKFDLQHEYIFEKFCEHISKLNLKNIQLLMIVYIIYNYLNI